MMHQGRILAYVAHHSMWVSAEAKLRPVLNELAYNLESFNPAFTAVLLKVRRADPGVRPQQESRATHVHGSVRVRTRQPVSSHSFGAEARN